jgi:uncharacterized membrane protein
MVYNIHPIFVHFPIAMLFVYSVIHILPFNKWFPKFAWKHIEFVLLVVGVLGAFAALATGETAEHMVRPDHTLVEYHSTFASIATWLYGILLVGEIAYYWNRVAATVGESIRLVQYINKLSTFIEKYLQKGWISKTLALCALIAIVVTGILGGVITYGVTADPFAVYLLQILGI